MTTIIITTTWSRIPVLWSILVSYGGPLFMTTVCVGVYNLFTNRVNHAWMGGETIGRPAEWPADALHACFACLNARIMIIVTVGHWPYRPARVTPLWPPTLILVCSMHCGKGLSWPLTRCTPCLADVWTMSTMSTMSTKPRVSVKNHFSPHITRVCSL